MSRNRNRARARDTAGPDDDTAPCKAGNCLSGSKAVVLERADCCLACIKRYRSRWGKYPDKKPEYKNHRRNGETPPWPSQDA